MLLCVNYTKVVQAIQYSKMGKEGLARLGYEDLKYRTRFSTSVDSNLLMAFKDLATAKRQPLSWLTDDAIEDFLSKNGIHVTKSAEDKGKTK